MKEQHAYAVLPERKKRRRAINKNDNVVDNEAEEAESSESSSSNSSVSSSKSSSSTESDE